jgi:signal transduction histidine kinase
LLNEALLAACLPPSCQVIREYGQDLPLVESSSLLVDTFLELITNARKAMLGRPHQRLQVRTCAERDDTGLWVVVEVGDTGTGMTSEQMAHLWTMFQPSSDGLGFGLWWIRTFIERQGGTIACLSEPGVGSCFTVRLPACSGQTHP